MITASEAREIADRIKAKNLKNERKMAEEIITDAVNEGCDSYRFKISVSSDLLEWLKSLGYQVTRYNSRDVEVRW